MARFTHLIAVSSEGILYAEVPADEGLDALRAAVQEEARMIGEDGDAMWADAAVYRVVWADRWDDPPAGTHLVWAEGAQDGRAAFGMEM